MSQNVPSLLFVTDRSHLMRANEASVGSNRNRRAFIHSLIALLVASSTALAQDAGPRLGTYDVLLAGGTSSNVVHRLVLKAGEIYEIHELTGALRGTGKYRYDAAQKRVFWLDGINYEMGRGGTFSVEEGGKHRIMLGSKTYAMSQ